MMGCMESLWPLLLPMSPSREDQPPAPTPSAISRAVFPRPSSRQRLSSESPLAFPFPGSCGASFRILKAARRGPTCSEPLPRTPVSGPSLVGAMGGDGRKQLGRRFLQARPDSSLSVASSSVLSCAFSPQASWPGQPHCLLPGPWFCNPASCFSAPSPSCCSRSSSCFCRALQPSLTACTAVGSSCWPASSLVLVPRAGSASLILLERSPRG